ncbi:MAG: hypothetical protein IPG44_16005 [Anaerolineales bacterium]|nr:hypothetical protein [Anaerolineales bacterium]
MNLQQPLAIIGTSSEKPSASSNHLKGKPNLKPGEVVQRLRKYGVDRSAQTAATLFARGNKSAGTLQRNQYHKRHERTAPKN